MFENNSIILGIESSCDDTCVSVIKNDLVLSNIVLQQKIHKKYGGVYPEIASRSHQKNIINVFDLAIKKSKIKLNEINAVAFTICPGLIGSLLIGASFAKSLSLALNIPIIGVNHIHAHVFAHFIKDKKQKKPSFPFICLTISGGHTQLILVKNFLNIKTIGKTIDDSVGEALDKCGKLIGLDYPSGKLIEKYSKNGDSNKFWFCDPNIKNLDFSFSGFKTSFMYFIKKNLNINSNFIKNELFNICASLQKNISHILLKKVIFAIKKYNINKIALSGGVSGNRYIKNFFKKKLSNKKIRLYFLNLKYTTDNAAMIAMLGQIKFNKYKKSDDLSITPFLKKN